MRKLDLINRRWLMAAAVTVGLLVVSSPIWSWYLKSEHQLNVLIVDKTVPDTSYRSHAGLTWMLNNAKYVQPSGSSYSPSKDYFGFKPLSGGKYRVDAVPDNIDNYDLIYLASMYGVDKEQFTGKQPGPTESKSLYGGMTKSDFEPIRSKLLTKGGTLIAERDLLGKPTSPELREDMYSLLNLTWDGWSYKYVADLAGNEVPDKLKASVAAIANGGTGSWSYKGSGYLFMNEFTEENLVLTEADLAGGAPSFAYTAEGEQQLGLPAKGKQAYNGWIDAIKPADEREVLANYKLALSPSGQEKLSRRYIPLTMPAIIHHQNERNGTYYFNGQFSVNTDLPSIYQSSIQTALRKLPTWHDSEDAFYWETYIPLMKAIIDRGMTKPSAAKQVETLQADNTSYSARVFGDHFQTLKNGKWSDFTIKGVNIGMGKPGAFPGNAAIGRDEYYRWFQQIAAMNANAIRVYTLQPPAFYEALYEFNQTTDKPLYLFHGAWVLEDALVSSGNAFSDAVMKPFHEEIVDVVDAVHGKASLPKRAGHAYGSYTYDVSPYLLGWILGIEWDPHAVADTNKLTAHKQPFDGRYIYTKGASPFENWLAQGMEYMATYEQDHYHMQHALSFTNWPTTDMLKHPLESFVEEDMSVVNPNHIYTKDGFYPGSFASYHIYPYYPDFMNNEYTDYKDKSGMKNNYAGYLHALKAVHRLPILVAEFGIPSSRGMTHRNVSGKDQGHHSEQEQGQLIAGLYEDMLNEGYMGGMIFSWQDEWFKRTWNTMEYDNAHRRPFWSNVQTNEQYFGLLSFDPGENVVPIDVDGDTLDWDALHLAPIYKAADSTQNLKALYISNDSEYVYLRLDYRKLSKDDIHTSIMFDTVPGQGNTKLPKGVPLANKVGFDFYIDLASASYAETFVDSYYDTFYYDYANLKKLIPIVAGVSTKNNGMYNPIRLVLNKGSRKVLPSGKVLNYPFESYHTGLLQEGNSNTRAADYNSLADYDVNEQSGVIELRIPWLMLNAKDPSLHEMTGDLWASGKGNQASVTTKGFHMLVVQQNSGGSGGKLSSLPELKTGEPVTLSQLKLFQWGEWNQPAYHERLKRSYEVLKKEFGKY
ncbi:hypothetical protein [Paenibacillus albus]|uniref:Family 2 glycosyl transferase n=1 Tax=Paenibacillus albus TaxID=2495582 RepID=A0A3Q8X950_9BACL|nr:hypothetical protein [Paenibacillus albus]AZN43290.1 hypothetical protein EJC50_29085 [Paenibacillus albus]